jgi:hypothetical protein
MRSGPLFRAALLCGIGALCAASSPARAQAPPLSLGEAARRLREQQKPHPQPAKIWTNEDVPALPSFGVSVVGPVPESLTKKEGPAAKDAAAPASPEAATEVKGVEADLAQEKARFDTLSKELDLLQRELALDQQQLYSSPAYSSDAQGKARLDAETAQIPVKQGEVEASKAKVAELEAKLAKLKGAAPATATKPPAATQPQA